MADVIRHYFAAEQAEAALFVLVGALALALAYTLWRCRHALAAMAFPLVAVAAIQLVVGLTVYLRTDAQVSTLLTRLVERPAEFQRTETARMVNVMHSFRVYRGLEIALMVGGAVLALRFRRPHAAHAVGLGLLVQAGLMLALDFFAEARGKHYLAAVQAMTL